jgi:2-haloalkanoic acid dehalogenase type II
VSGGDGAAAPLTTYRALTFDCYGTLIDWESGLYEALQPLLRAGAVTRPRDAVLADFARHEAAQEAATPAMLYRGLLAETHRRLSREWGVSVPEDVHVAFGRSVPQWPVFDDTVAALRYLKGHYKLVILSNVDRESFAGSNRRLGVEFDAICTAEDIGSYKPDLRNFHYLLETVAALGVGGHEILHTAQSLHHDHVPAKALGLATAWIDRRHDREGWGATVAPEITPAYDFRFESLGALAEAHRAQLAQR